MNDYMYEYGVGEVGGKQGEMEAMKRKGMG